MPAQQGSAANRPGSPERPGSTPAQDDSNIPRASGPAEPTAADKPGDAQTPASGSGNPSPTVDSIKRAEAAAASGEAQTEAIPKSAAQKPGNPSGAGQSDTSKQDDDDAKTAAIPAISNPSDAATAVLPVQQPSDRDQPRPGGTQQGDRVVPPTAGPPPVTRPPATPRPGAGPKNSVPQGPSGPAQAGPPADQARSGMARPPAKPRQAASAPSPADAQPTVPAQPLSPRPPQPRQVAPPQHVPPAAPNAPATPAGGRNKRWLIVAGAAVVVVIALIAAVVGIVGGGEDNSPEGRVTAAVNDYAGALDSGDLEELRAATCGPLHEFYKNIAPDQFAGVYRLSVDQKKVPKVDSVDSVQITGDKAVAQASVYTEADPDKRIARTFDLQQTPDGWKVCDPPNAAAG